MSVFENIPLGPPSTSEPAWHPAIRGSFLFVPTAGMRVAPEVLVLEIYREIFFKDRTHGTERHINPFDDEDISNDAHPEKSITNYTQSEKAFLFALRGRSKQNSQSAEANFFTPAYPSLARRAWPRKQSDRVIKDFFFRAFSQKIYGNTKKAEENIQSISKSIYSALRGFNTQANKESANVDILSLEYNTLTDCCSEDLSLEKIRALIGESTQDNESKRNHSVFNSGSKHDPLANRICDDFIELCKLEKSIDRLQWLELLKCFLRISTSIWFLSQIQITIYLRDALMDVLTTGQIPSSSDWPLSKILKRHSDLLKPSITPTNQIHEHVESYMKARVELNLLVALVEKHSKSDWRKKRLTVDTVGSNSLPIVNLMTCARKAKKQIDLEVGASSLLKDLGRECENHRAWLAPRKKGYGQGSNYDEFLRVLRRMTKGDEDGGYLLTPQSNGFVVFPGHLMLKLFTFLSGKTVEKRNLVLADVEHHFSEYGIDFGQSGSARPKLIRVMQETGMLRGSPDAGDSVEILRQYE
jgi:hypothetical protein